MPESEDGILFQKIQKQRRREGMQFQIYSHRSKEKSDSEQKERWGYIPKNLTKYVILSWY